MKGDFTRLTFQRDKHFSRVLRQQGRVTVDADDNEQTAILLHQLRTMARDIMGAYATPANGGGFDVSVDGDNVLLSPGRMYVDGILVENDDDAYSVDPAIVQMIKESGETDWLYLDVWERHITSIEDDYIREKALGGPDTSTRAKVEWRVGILSVPSAFEDRIAQLNEQDPNGANADIQSRIAELTQDMSDVNSELAPIRKNNKGTPSGDICGRPGILLPTISNAHMAARVDPGAGPTDPCIISPDAKYRGLENQLYRVEIHREGMVGDASGPTFKWSRDNGSVATRWLGTSGTDASELIVAHGRGFTAGCWIELTDDVAELAGIPGTLVKVVKVQGSRLSIDQSTVAPAWSEDFVNPKVRRWDQVQRDDVVLDEGAVPLTESGAGGAPIVWLDLEDGIQVMFVAGGEYRTGDYWLIPARVATGSIEWPDSTALPPHGIEHHYAPLGFAWVDDDDIRVTGCHCPLVPASPCGATFRPAGPPPAPIDIRVNRVAAPMGAPAAPVVAPRKAPRRKRPR